MLQRGPERFRDGPADGSVQPVQLPGLLQGQPDLPPQQRPLQGQGVHVQAVPLQDGVQRYENGRRLLRRNCRGYGCAKSSETQSKASKEILKMEIFLMQKMPMPTGSADILCTVCFLIPLN